MEPQSLSLAVPGTSRSLSEVAIRNILREHAGVFRQAIASIPKRATTPLEDTDFLTSLFFDCRALQDAVFQCGLGYSEEEVANMSPLQKSCCLFGIPEIMNLTVAQHGGANLMRFLLEEILPQASDAPAVRG